MSNHISASDTKFVKLNYNNGITTLVPCMGLNPIWVASQLKKAIEDYEKYPRKIFNEDEGIGLVRYIDFACNYDLNCTQLFALAEEIMIGATLDIPYPYDLGEDETAEEVEKITGIEVKKWN